MDNTGQTLLSKDKIALVIGNLHLQLLMMQEEIERLKAEKKEPVED